MTRFGEISGQTFKNMFLNGPTACSVWQNFEPTWQNVHEYWANSNCCKSPNNEKYSSYLVTLLEADMFTERRSLH